jgi:hypothetical protein
MSRSLEAASGTPSLLVCSSWPAFMSASHCPGQSRRCELGAKRVFYRQIGFCRKATMTSGFLAASADSLTSAGAFGGGNRSGAPRGIRGNSFGGTTGVGEGKATTAVGKKPGRPDHEDAANLAAQAGPVNTMVREAARRAVCWWTALGAVEGPKSLLPPTVGPANRDRPGAKPHAHRHDAPAGEKIVKDPHKLQKRGSDAPQRPLRSTHVNRLRWQAS